MAGEIELWSLKRFGRVPTRFDWSGSLKRSSWSGTAQTYLSLSCSTTGDSAVEEPGFAPGGKLPGAPDVGTDETMFTDAIAVLTGYVGYDCKFLAAYDQLTVV